MNPKTKTAALIGALLPTVSAAPANAAQPPVVDLRGASVGSYALDADGNARLSGAVTGVPFDGAYTATLTSSDGSLPDPEPVNRQPLPWTSPDPRSAPCTSPPPVRSAALGPTRCTS